MTSEDGGRSAGPLGDRRTGRSKEIIWEDLKRTEVSGTCGSRPSARPRSWVGTSEQVHPHHAGCCAKCRTRAGGGGAEQSEGRRPGWRGRHRIPDPHPDAGSTQSSQHRRPWNQTSVPWGRTARRARGGTPCAPDPPACPPSRPHEAGRSPPSRALGHRAPPSTAPCEGVRGPGPAREALGSRAHFPHLQQV